MRDELQFGLAAARSLSVEELPRLLGDLEEIRTTALARLAAPAPTQRPDQLLSVEEAAERLGVSANYLYRNHSRFGFTRRMGRNLRFSAQGIETHISRGIVGFVGYNKSASRQRLRAAPTLTKSPF